MHRAIACLQGQKTLTDHTRRDNPSLIALHNCPLSLPSITALDTSRGAAEDFHTPIKVNLCQPAPACLQCGANEFRNPVSGCLTQKFLDTAVI